MEQFITILFCILLCLLVALLGKNRKIGFGRSFVLCFFLSPLIGLPIILLSKKKDVEFIDVQKDE